MKRLVFFLALTSFSDFSTAQKLLDIHPGNSCSFYGETITDKVYGFESSEEARNIVARISDAIGLKPNFEIRAANVPNAVAVVQGDKRLILYSENFIASMKYATGTDWGGIAVLAHEIAHHLNGHTLTEEGSRPELELEADEFAGFVLAKMGATLDDAQAAYKMLKNTNGSTSHPPKSARLEAVAVGWKRGHVAAGVSSPGSPAGDELKNENSNKPTSSSVRQLQVCYSCRGVGWVNTKAACSTCSGSGWSTCPSCKGKEPSLAGWSCMKCRGSGKLRCSPCNGLGMIDTKAVCDKCNGQGRY